MSDSKTNPVHGNCSVSAPQEEFHTIQGVNTPVVKIGQLKEKNDADKDACRVLMLVIPGNPGVPQFYIDFMQELHSQCGGEIPVWAVGHAGHGQPSDQKLSLSDIVSTNDNLYGLEAQISHKVAFIQEQIPADVTLILIGHSIGCYMILNLLDSLPHSRVLHSYMLFPTVERMAVSPNGKRMTPIFLYLRWLIVLVAFFLSFIPESIQMFFINWRYKDKGCPTCCYNGILKTITPSTANFSTYLAKHEMKKVTTIQKNLVQKHLERVGWYFGACDHWCPVDYYKELKAEFPSADAKLCKLNFKHAFVLESKEVKVMAKIVWDWAKQQHQSVLS